jgi:hypothetical protein
MANATLRYQEFRSSGVQEFRSQESGVQEFRSSGVQEFRSSGIRRKKEEEGRIRGKN